jgi:hypothetical protein
MIDVMATDLINYLGYGWAIEPAFALNFDDEVIPANSPGTTMTGNRSVLRLHISGHPVFAGVIMPFFGEFNHLVFSIPPDETIRAALFLLQAGSQIKTW